MTSPPEISTPTLLRLALHAYGDAIQRALVEEGFGDAPRTGFRILGTLAHQEMSAHELAGRLAMSKQAVGRLVDVLVAREYVRRSPHPGDRRQIVLSLTERGQRATRAGQRAAAQIEASLSRRSGIDLQVTRATLAALANAGPEDDPT